MTQCDPPPPLVQYASVLAFLVTCELAAGVTAAVKRREVGSMPGHIVCGRGMYIPTVSWTNG